MSLTAYPTLRLKLTMPQALRLQFLPAIPGTNAQAAADRAEQAAQQAEQAALDAVNATAGKVSKSGDTMTGLLILSGDPAAALGAATKQYVDAHAGGITTINGQDGPAITLVAGSNVTIDSPAADQVRIAASGGGGGGITSTTPPTITGGHLAGFSDATGTVIREIKVGPTMTIDGTFTLNTTAGGGNVMAVNSPAAGEIARWTSGVEIEGAMLSEAGIQPLDADLTSLAAASASGAGPSPSGLYYRKAANTWAPLNLSGLTINTGTDTITAAAGGGNVSNVGTPTNGQWARWTSATTIEGVAAGSTGFVLKTGDTMSGDLTITKALPILTLNGTASAQDAVLQLAKSGLTRWTVRYDATPESGGDAGSDFIIHRYSDAGAYLGAPLFIARASGICTIPDLRSNNIRIIARQVFTASGTYTPTTGMQFAIAEVIAGGGGGGGAGGTASQYYVAGGGGSGGYSRILLSAAAVGASQAVTVGGGGAGGLSTPAGGSSGGNSAVGSLCIAIGGAGGNFSSAAQNGQGGAGGSSIGAVGDVVAAGSPGEGGFYNGLNTTIGSRSGMGGSSVYGGGALAIQSGVGGAANNYGSGGSGASQSAAGNAAGGNGSSGIVIITEFCS